MGRHHSSSGFTIIESMLFLAITGLLVITFMVGTGASINIQRYRDSVETFKSLLQEQYSAVSNVRNDRSNNLQCGAQAQTEEAPTTGEIRGQSSCVLLGRYVAIQDETMTFYGVVARQQANPANVTDDLQSLRTNYILNVSSISKQTKPLEWGAKIAWPVSGAEAKPAGTARSIALLFLRSPDSGQVYTFTSTDTAEAEPTPAFLRDMIVGGDTIPGQGARTICINSNNGFVNADMAIYLTRYANGPTSIETRSNEFAGGDAKC